MGHQFGLGVAGANLPDPKPVRLTEGTPRLRSYRM